MPRSNKDRFDSSTFQTSFGLFLALLGVTCLLAPLTRLGYIQWPVFYLLGLTGYALLGAFCLLVGLHAMFHRRWKPFSLRMRVGLLVTSIGIYFLTASIEAQLLPDMASVPFLDDLNAAFASSRHSLYSNPEFISGQIGILTIGNLSSNVGFFLGYIIGGSVAGLGLVLVFYPLLKSLFRFVRARIVLARAKKQKQREEKAKRDSLDFIIEGEGGPVPVPTFDDEEMPKAPGLSFASEQPNVSESAPTLQNTYNFTPAGGSTLPSRKSFRSEKAVAPVLNMEGAPSPLAPTSPREMPNPERSLYQANPVRSSGLREALFVPNGFEDDASGNATGEPIREEPKPALSEIMPSFLGAAASQEETLPPEPIVEEEEESEEEPAPIIKDEASTIVVGENPDDEEEYTPPSNDPIPLIATPSASEIIMPPEVQQPAPEEIEEAPAIPAAPVQTPVAPKPAPEPEPEPVDDELEGPLPPYTFPDASLLQDLENEVSVEDQQAECELTRANIDKIFAEFKVGAHVADVLVGPSITRYSVESDPGVSIQNIARIVPDLEVKLGGVAIRFAEKVLGSPYCALEIANTKRRNVSYKELFLSMPQRKNGPDLNIPFGLDIAGQLKCADLAKFPHMLIAGTSGSGKSIFAHGLLMSLIMRNRPEDLKFVLIDPKRGVEMARYKDLPHLLCPIVKEPIPAKNALKKLVELMNERYRMLEATGTTDIKEYNQEYALPEGKKRMPYIVCFIDEFADIVGECKEIMDYVNTLAAKARSCGIHIIVATQRPDVKVITGTLKSNLLCRVALTVASSVDSVTILGEGGAESLYGNGDMLIDCQQLSKREFVRAQGCFTSLREGRAVCDFIRAQLPPKYDPDFLDLEDHDDDMPEVRDGGYAPIVQQAAGPTPAEIRNASNEEKYVYIRSIIMTRETCSISMIQRDFEVGFPRAGKILSRLQKEGVVAPPSDSPNSSKGCRVVIHSEEELQAALAKAAESPQP